MREIVIRRGRDWWEWRERAEPDSKFRTTKIPAKPICERPARCRWCEGIHVSGINFQFPVQMPLPGIGVPVHVIMPHQASHLVAIEWCQAHPRQPVTVGWLLTEEEIVAGKKGMAWPDDTGGKES